MKSRSCSVEVTTKSIPGLSDSKGNNIKKMFIENGLSKILIHRENIDHVVGYVSLLDSLRSFF